MSECIGDITTGTKVDQSMREFLDEEAARLDVTIAELHRRLFDTYRESREQGLECPHCGEPITLTLNQ